MWDHNTHNDILVCGVLHLHYISLYNYINKFITTGNTLHHLVTWQPNTAPAHTLNMYRLVVRQRQTQSAHKGSETDPELLVWLVRPEGVWAASQGSRCGDRRTKKHRQSGEEKRGIRGRGEVLELSKEWRKSSALASGADCDYKCEYGRQKYQFQLCEQRNESQTLRKSLTCLCTDSNRFKPFCGSSRDRWTLQGRERETEMAEGPKIELFVKVGSKIIVICCVCKISTLPLCITQDKCSIF